MKSIFALILLSLNLTGFAQTSMVVSAVRPLNCEVANHSMINLVYELHLIEETNKYVTFGFKTELGSCVNRYFYPARLSQEFTTINIMRDEITMPWQKEGVEGQISFLSETTLAVSMTFDKNIFKRKSQRSYLMNFLPFGYNNYYFPWRVNLELRDGSDVSFSIQ